MSVRDLFETMSYGPAPEDPAPALDWIARISDPAGALEVVGATGQPLARLVPAGAAEVEAAVQAAARAQAEWAARPGAERAAALSALARLVEARAGLLALVQTLETGRPIRLGRADPAPLARAFAHHAAEARLARPEGLAPLGLCALVTPGTRPLAALALAAPALATGNAVLLKPSPRAPLSALLLAELAAGAGLPTGLLAVLCGEAETGAALVAHPSVAAVAFTGRAEPAREIRRATAGQGKALALDIRSPLPFLILDDADLDSAAEGLAEALCQGHAPRLLVQEGVAPRFEARMRRRIEALRTGDPLDRNTDLAAPAPHLDIETFRTPAEAVEMANNARTAAAAALWAEGLALALGLGPRLKAPVVWVNAVGLADPAVPADRLRESGFGAAGGPDGWRDRMKPADAPPIPPARPLSGGSRPEITAAVATARAAAAGWATFPARERAARLGRLADGLAGLPLDPTEVAEAVRRLRDAAAGAETLTGMTLPPAFTLREPLGVIGLICPGEAPLAGLVALLAPALAAGNCCVVVPAESEPRLGPLLAGLPGLPPGVVTFVPGRHAELAPALAGHMDVDAVWAFSTPEVAATVEAGSVTNLKRTWTGPDWRAADLRRATAQRTLWLPGGI